MSTAEIPSDLPQPDEVVAARRPQPARTAWARNLEAPLRDFLRTQSGSAVILAAGALLALLWINVDAGSYERVWTTRLSIRLGGAGLDQDLRHWVNDGLMTFFFFVTGLEARREFDLGELRDRRRLLLPMLAGVGGMLAPVLIFLIVNGSADHGGWGAAMSTDTAFALGMLALVGRRFPDSLRAFILTVAVVDDLVALVVITVVFTSAVQVTALLVALAALAGLGGLRAARVRNGLLYFVFGVVAWVALERSGVDPVVIGLILGLVTIAYPANRADLERATDLFKVFREQPTSEYARTARAGLSSAISPNERYQQLYHPLTSYLIVPLFALANAGIVLNGSFLAHAYGSPITLGIIAAYLLGKPLGISGATAIVGRVTRGRIVPPVGWGSVLGGAAIAGIGFTVSLLIATLAFHGQQLAQAKLGILTTLVGAPLVSAVVLRATRRLPRGMRLRAIVGSSPVIVDLAVPVDPERDHVRGPEDARVTLLEYGDLECPFCGQAETAINEVLREFGEIRYVWRHLPLNDVHPHAQLAAEASEAAAAQGRFWEMHDALLAHQDELNVRTILAQADAIGLDKERFREDLRRRRGADRIAEDVESADLSGVSGTPSFFINGHRYQDPYDAVSLAKAVKLAGARSLLSR
ncbi:MAG TPA: Na+/H+ antiporter NhaA [Solirubrobacteraceae bacterium]|nr:Na+/H+ antiporter NhaA [Solirubrobacteraceae bacterium]